MGAMNRRVASGESGIYRSVMYLLWFCMAWRGRTVVIWRAWRGFAF